MDHLEAGGGRGGGSVLSSLHDSQVNTSDYLKASAAIQDGNV